MALNTALLQSCLDAFSQGFVKRPHASTENVNFHSQMIQKVVGVVQEAASKEAATRANKGLSDEGKSTTIATGATATAAKLAFLERVVSRVEGERATAHANLTMIPPPSAAGTDPLLQYLFAKEIRDRYQGLTQQEKDLAFLKVAEADGGDATLWAFQQAPVPMISPDIKVRALEERGRRLHPQTYAEFQQSDLLHESLSGVRAALIDWLRGLGGDTAVIFKELGGYEPAPSSIDVARKQVQHA
jgi:hypothetical protein